MGNSSSEFSSSTTAFQAARNADLTGKVAIVTGANIGIGLETARVLYCCGAHVVLACRDLSKMSNAKKEIEETKIPKGISGAVGTVTCIQLDLSKQSSVKKFVEQFLLLNLPLHYLILNAGLTLPEKKETEDGFDMVMATNHFGHFSLTLLLLGVLAKSAPARIVVLSSEVHKAVAGKMNLEDIQWKKRNYTYGGLPTYSESKLANHCFTIELNRLLQQAHLKITVNSVHPGVVASNFGSNFNPVLALLYSKVAVAFMKTPQQGAATTIYCALAPELESKGGLYFSDCRVANGAAVDQKFVRELFGLTEKITGIEFNTVLASITNEN